MMSKFFNRLTCAAAALITTATAIFGQSGAGENFFAKFPRAATYALSDGIPGVNIGNRLTVEIADAGDDWEITESVRFPGGGQISDTAFVDKKTLALKRGISREFEKITEYEIKNGKLSGTETDGKKIKKFALDAGAGAEIFNTRAFSFALCARLPLAENYAARLTIFDPADKKLEAVDFKVMSSERINIGTEAFDCYRLAVGASQERKGGYTVWVDKETRRIIKLKGRASGGLVRAAMELETSARPRTEL